jgi:hypothetical protein
MRRRPAESATPPAFVGTCGRCGFTLPLAYFPRGRSTCTECHDKTPLDERVAWAAVDYRLRCHAALHLLNLGLTVAAAEVLANNSWPSLREARAMQQRAVA